MAHDPVPERLQTVLIVEDDPIAQELVGFFLEREAFATVRVGDGETALVLLREGRVEIDWLYVDIRLPGPVSGWIVGAEFHLMHPDRAVVYATGSAPPSAAQTAGSIFLTKPFRPEQVAAFLAEQRAKAAGRSSG